MKRPAFFSLVVVLLLSIAGVQGPVSATIARGTARAVTQVPTAPATASAVSVPVGTIIAKVSAWLLPLRDAPSRRGAMLARLKYRTLLTVIGVNKAHTWIKVETADQQKTGWVSVFYVWLTGGRLKSVPVVQQ